MDGTRESETMENSVTYKTMIKAEDHDMIQKMAYLYWYEHFSKDGWTNDKHKEMYMLIKNEVMEYGYAVFKDSRD